MKADDRFISKSQEFWAHVRLISQDAKYKEKGADKVKAIRRDEIVKSLKDAHLDVQRIVDADGRWTPFGDSLFEYFKYRADTLNSYIEPLLMDIDDARSVFEKLKLRLKPNCPLPMNRQKGDKRHPRYFTGIVNMLIEANVGQCACDYDPTKLATFIQDGELVRTLARRLDGAFPGLANPIAIWEIKEYYSTKSFGSRVADGIFETQLDGMELMDLLNARGVKVYHCFFVDGHDTWWRQGKPYLCRIIDLINMGFVDEVLFGTEVLDRLPLLVSQWTGNPVTYRLTGKVK